MLRKVEMVMPDLRAKLGHFGEQAAAAHLLRQGYELLERNWRGPSRAQGGPGGELDLVLRDGAALVFVEVRTRRIAGPQPGNAVAEESVGPLKQRRLIALAYAYLEAMAVAANTPWRIDVVAIDVDRAGRIARLQHIRDAVEEI
jgi:putative endonuclease